MKVPPHKILAWITYKGRRIPITERILRGASVAPKEEAEKELEKLVRLDIFYFPPGTKIAKRVDWAPCGLAARKVDQVFPGVLEGVTIYPFLAGIESPVTGLTFSVPILEHSRRVCRVLRSHLDRDLSEAELRAVLRKYGLVIGLDEQLVEVIDSPEVILTALKEFERRANAVDSFIDSSHIKVFVNVSVKKPFIPAAATYVKSAEDIWLHEFGHVVHSKVGRFPEWQEIYLRNRSKIKSAYGRSNMYEAFAEEFLRYVKKGKNSTREINQFFKQIQKEWSYY